ncbi:thiolase family protein [bacterium]|nr:thiolase family protein [bacterium]
MEVKTVGIVDFARSPISKQKGGALNKVSPLELCNQVLRKLMARNPNIPFEQTALLVVGTAFPESAQGMNIGRQVVIKAGLPESVPGLTVNQFCASAQQSAWIVVDNLALGRGDFGISCGLEHMTHVPMGGYNPWMDEELVQKDYYLNMGLTAEKLARELNISRSEQDEFAMASHRKALKAWAEGRFTARGEVVPIDLPDGTALLKDEAPIEPNPEKISALKPVFDKDGTVTAASSSPITTGAGAIIWMTEEKARELGIKLRVTFVSCATVGVDPTRMGMGPIPASIEALKRANLTIDEIDVIEMNEAFAAQSIYCIRKLGWPQEKINKYGGAIAIGHPLGMSGQRIIGQAVTTLEDLKGTYALATMCIGGGMGSTTILKRVE